MKIIFWLALLLQVAHGYCNDLQLDTSIISKSELPTRLHPDDSIRCICAASSADIFTGDDVCELPAQPFFIFTPQAYRLLLEGEEFLTAKAALVKNGKDYALHLFMEINSDKAGEQFGDVGRRTFLTLELLRHKPVFGITHQGGKATVKGGRTYYEAVYKMDTADARRLRKGELSRVRLHWTKGKQTFEVYDVDVLKRQFTCWESSPLR